VAERPRRLVLVAGTGTEVGKTWVAAQLLRSVRATGLTVAARKLAQSFAPGDPTDAEVLAAATGERAEEVCLPHRSYEVPMAPFMAAARLGRPPFTLADLVAELRWPAGVDVGVVEAAGGVRSPTTGDGSDTVDLADALEPDEVLLVANAGLGTINAVRLCVHALAGRPTVVVLNRFDPGDELHRANHHWLAEHVGTPVTTSR
jgi:dethiobiotin synthetase